MKLTVVIPTLNRVHFVRDTVFRLLKQSYKNVEILIIDQSDIDKYDELLSIPFPAETVKIIRQEQKSASRARNAGLLHAKGEITLFLDDDIIIENPDFLQNHVRHYVDRNLAGVSGAILNPGQSYRTDRHWASNSHSYGWLFFPINFASGIRIGNGWAGNLSVRTRFALDIGGMDERFEKGAFREESDFCTRLVKKYGLLQYDPEASLIHIGAATGGLRTFKNVDTVRAQHHFDGFFYYTRKNIRFYRRLPHLVSFFLVFYPLGNVLSFSRLSKSLYRTFKGIGNAGRMLKAGPIYIQKDDYSSVL